MCVRRSSGDLSPPTLTGSTICTTRCCARSQEVEPSIESPYRSREWRPAAPETPPRRTPPRCPGRAINPIKHDPCWDVSLAALGHAAAEVPQTKCHTGVLAQTTFTGLARRGAPRDVRPSLEASGLDRACFPDVVYDPGMEPTSLGSPHQSASNPGHRREDMYEEKQVAQTHDSANWSTGRSSKTGRPSAAPTGLSISILSIVRTNHEPSRVRLA
jgi:hypothetical protein